MNQIEYEKHWLHFLDTYVRPLQEKVFIGYFHQVRLLTFFAKHLHFRVTINIILMCQTKLNLTMLLLAASPSYNELHGQVQAGRTALTQTSSRQLHLHHQHCHEPSRYT